MTRRFIVITIEAPEDFTADYVEELAGGFEQDLRERLSDDMKITTQCECHWTPEPEGGA